jgi:twitching motility two-component system response regulator PilH
MRTRVLIVDDDPGAAEAFGPMLTSSGYDVSVAADGESGLDLIERDGPAAILVDLHLPTIDGVEFLRRLRSGSSHAEIPVAVLTGDYLVDDDVTQRLQRLGARLFFKPLWEDDLNRIVSDLLGVGSETTTRQAVT